MISSRLTVMLIAGAVLACCALVARPTAKAIDASLFGYRLTDRYIRLKDPTDWAAAPRLRSKLNFHWATPDGSGVIRIAHAMGSWRGDRDRNTLAALSQSLRRGFKIAEVDLALSDDGQLYCFHGVDGRPALVPASQKKQLCTLDQLIGKMRSTSFVLVLDLKSSFARSAALVATRVPVRLRGRIVFQLYGPDDVAAFNHLPDGFAGPIVTLYKTLRTVNHLDPHLARIGARVVTVPFARVDEFSRWGRRERRTLLTHPIDSCPALHRIQGAGFAGGYMDADLHCDSAST
jgi:glycerophosphoryl diester phosphodiesterase